MLVLDLFSHSQCKHEPRNLGVFSTEANQPYKVGRGGLNLWKEFFLQVTKVKPTGTFEEAPIQLSVNKSPEHASNPSTSKMETGGSVQG